MELLPVPTFGQTGRSEIEIQTDRAEGPVQIESALLLPLRVSLNLNSSKN
jgi:hypothetical protein